MSRSTLLTRQLLFWAIALGGAAFDLSTKSAIFEKIGEPESPPMRLVANVLELRTSYNPGALWGIGKGWSHSSTLFAVLSIVAGLAIYYWLFVRGAAADRRLTAALGLIMAGALGNCYDRVVLGKVRDFVRFHVDSIGFDFPIFNFADNMLVVGAMILMVLALLPEPTSPGQESESASASSAEPALPESAGPVH